MANKLLAGAADDASIIFEKERAILNIPAHDPFKFAMRPIGEGDDSRRAACYSRSGTALRAVGPIVADMDLERATSVDASSVAKMRAADERGRSKKREMKMADNLPGPPPKKKRKAPTKRPRATPSRPSTGISSSRAPSLRNLRSAPSNNSPFESPSVSPGRIAASHNGSTATRPNSSRRSTPTGADSIPPASGTRRVSPPGNSLTSGFGKGNRQSENAEGLRPNLSKASLRSLTPTKSSRISPDGSRGSRGSFGSRGPSPRPPSVHSPSSPVLRSRNLDLEALRVNVMHFLASSPKQLHHLMSRFCGSDAAPDAKERLRSVLRDVAINKNSIYTLKGRFWSEISEDHPTYTELERTQMKVARSGYYGSKGSSEAETATDGVMTDAQLDSELKAFQKLPSEDKKATISSEKDELELRKSFQKWYPVYAQVISRLEDMSKTFKNLDRRYREQCTAEQREIVVQRITSQYEKYKARREELIKVLPLLHAKLGSIRSALDLWAKEAEDSME